MMKGNQGKKLAYAACNTVLKSIADNSLKCVIEYEIIWLVK